ncbi:MAG: hypothetical protein IJ123_07690 [Blautia sp.]|nr:hypothetical protein [Blautia sp.]
MSCVIFGAGKIARGFIGHLLYLSGIPFVFVEKNRSLVDLINARGSYTVNILGNPERNCIVQGARALSYDDKEEIAGAIAEADAVFHAVGGKNLEEIVPYLAAGVAEKAKSGGILNIVACENWKKPADIIREGIEKRLSSGIASLYDNRGEEEGFSEENEGVTDMEGSSKKSEGVTDLEGAPKKTEGVTDLEGTWMDNEAGRVMEYFREKVGVTEAVILRSAIEPEPEQLREDPLMVNVQDYWELHVDKSRIKGSLPEITGLHLIEEFGGFLERKFYTYNAANGTLSYMGALLGYEILAEAAHDERILDILEGVYSETAKALCIKYGMDLKEQMEFTRGSLAKLQNYVIVDKIERNARDPLRKLGPDDRLVGSARMAASYGIIPENLCTAIAAALYYTNKDDPSAVELARLRKERGADYILENVCGLDPEGDLAGLIREKIKLLREEGYIKD